MGRAGRGAVVSELSPALRLLLSLLVVLHGGLQPRRSGSESTQSTRSGSRLSVRAGRNSPCQSLGFPIAFRSLGVWQAQG
eukprot:1745422-Rhodomonas_salina.1